MAVMMWTSCVLVAMVTRVTAYPTGAPEEACVTMVPDHPDSTTSGVSPFKININMAAYKPGSQISGTISSPRMSRFRGFLIQARAPMGKNASTPVGKFINPISTTQTICGMNDTQGLTHNNNTDKTSVTFTWKAPMSYEGDLVFQLTVVESYDPSRYWLKIMSDKVLDCSLHASSSNCAQLEKETQKIKVSQKQGLALRFESFRRKSASDE